LHLAALYDHPVVVQRLFAERENLEAVCAHSYTPLHLAALRGHPEVVQQLLAERADLEAVDTNSYTPLHLAALKGHSEVLQQLLAVGANFGAVGADSYTPLHLAALRGHPKVVQQLLAVRLRSRLRSRLRRRPLDYTLDYAADLDDNHVVDHHHVDDDNYHGDDDARTCKQPHTHTSVCLQHQSTVCTCGLYGAFSVRSVSGAAARAARAAQLGVAAPTSSARAAATPEHRRGSTLAVRSVSARRARPRYNAATTVVRAQTPPPHGRHLYRGTYTTHVLASNHTLTHPLACSTNPAEPQGHGVQEQAGLSVQRAPPP